MLVSDHGMAPTGSDKMIVLDEIVDASLYRAVEAGAYASFEATEGNVEAFEAAILREHDRGMLAQGGYPGALIRHAPPHSAPFCLPDTGWTITNRASDSEWSGGNHAMIPMPPKWPRCSSRMAPPFAAER